MSSTIQLDDIDTSLLSAVYSDRLFRPCILTPGVEDEVRRDCGTLFEWADLIEPQVLAQEASPITSFNLEEFFVPVTAFNKPIGYEVMGRIQENHVFCLELDFYEKPDSLKEERCGYIGRVMKIAGYRLLFVWMPSRIHDIKELKELFSFKFSENVGSAMIRDLRSLQTELLFHPPKNLMLRTAVEGKIKSGDDLMDLFMNSQQKVSTVPGIRYLQENITNQGNLKVGQCVELLWFNNPRFVRPATIVKVVGRRVQVRVDPTESMELIPDEKSDEDKDRQFDPSCVFWVDESSFYLVHVGWSMLNSFTLVANPEYTKHARNIAQALENDEIPPYRGQDVTRWQLTQCREQQHTRDMNLNLWRIGMKCELLDPLNGLLSILSVATFKRKLEDGYLEFSLDSDDGSDDTVSLYCTSDRLFPPGYSRIHGIRLSLDDEDNGVLFDWNKVPRSDWAPTELFKKEEPEKSDRFKVGAYLEVFSLKEHHMCHPAQIASIHGRLIRVQFVGWPSNEENDELYDVDSRDILPAGWCEMHGFRLDPGVAKK